MINVLASASADAEFLLKFCVMSAVGIGLLLYALISPIVKYRKQNMYFRNCENLLRLKQVRNNYENSIQQNYEIESHLKQMQSDYRKSAKQNNDEHALRLKQIQDYQKAIQAGSSRYVRQEQIQSNYEKAIAKRDFNIMTRNAKDFIISSGYIKIRNQFMKIVFDTTKSCLELCVSQSIVNNFKTHKCVDYLIKYFDMAVDANAIDMWTKLVTATEMLYESARKQNIPVAYFDSYFPKFTLYCIESNGNVKSKSELILAYDTVHKLKSKIDKSVSTSAHTSRQRSLMTSSLRAQVLARDNYTCQICGNSVYDEPNLLLEVDHIVPVSKGGKTELGNLQTLCWRCNRQKSDRL